MRVVPEVIRILVGELILVLRVVLEESKFKYDSLDWF